MVVYTLTVVQQNSHVNYETGVFLLATRIYYLDQAPTFQCVDFAFMMSEHAFKAGYWIFPAVDLADGHMECVAPIGKDLYTVEPQTNVVSLWAVKSNP